MRLFSLIGALLVLATSAPLRAADEPFDLYAFLPLTGSSAFLGRGESQGLQAAEKYVNEHGGIRGRPLHIVLQDDQSNPQIAVQLLSQVMAKGVAAIIGPGSGPGCAADLPLVVPSGPVMFCLSPSIQPPAGGFAFAVMPANRDQYANAMRYIRAKGIRTVAFIAATDASGQDSENGGLQALKYPDLRDLKLVAAEHMGITDVSVTAQMTRIKASGAQATIVFLTGPAFATLLRGANDVGYDGLILAGSSNAVKDQLVGYGSFLPKTLVFTTLPFQMEAGIPPAVGRARATFLAAMKEVTPDLPGVPQGVPWDPVTVLVDAFRKIGPQATAVQVRDYILGVHGFAGIMGYYDFRTKDQRGLDPRSTGAMTWDKATQTFVIVSKPAGVPL